MAKESKAILQNFLNKTSQITPVPEVNEDFPIKMISVYDLIPNPLNFYELSDIDKLEAEIELQGGIMTNFEVKEVDNGKYMIIAGHRRRQAIINLLAGKSETIKSDKVPCTVKTYSSQEEEIKALSLSNRSQRQKTPTEELKELQALKPILQREFDQKKCRGEATGRFRAYMAKFFGVSESTIQRIESRAKLDEEIKESLDEGIITPTAAAQITSLSAADQRAVYEDTKEQGVTVKAVQEKKREITTANPPIREANLEISETEIKMVALNEIRDMLIGQTKKIKPNESDFGRVTVNSVKLDKLGILVKVIENELEQLSGRDIFEDVQ